MVERFSSLGCGCEARFVYQATVVGDDARIDAGSSIKKKLEHPVSINESRYELRQRRTLVSVSLFEPKT